MTGIGVGLAALPTLALAADVDPGADINGAGLTGRSLKNAVEIVSLDPSGPAARSGLRQGDRVVDWVGGDLAELGEALNGAAETRLVLTVLRGLRQRQVQLVLEGDNQMVRP